MLPNVVRANVPWIIVTAETDDRHVGVYVIDRVQSNDLPQRFWRSLLRRRTTFPSPPQRAEQNARERISNANGGIRKKKKTNVFHRRLRRQIVHGLDTTFSAAYYGNLVHESNPLAIKCRPPSMSRPRPSLGLVLADSALVLIFVLLQDPCMKNIILPFSLRVWGTLHITPNISCPPASVILLSLL